MNLSYLKENSALALDEVKLAGLKTLFVFMESKFNCITLLSILFISLFLNSTAFSNLGIYFIMSSIPLFFLYKKVKEENPSENLSFFSKFLYKKRTKFISFNLLMLIWGIFLSSGSAIESDSSFSLMHLFIIPVVLFLCVGSIVFHSSFALLHTKNDMFKYTIRIIKDNIFFLILISIIATILLFIVHFNYIFIMFIAVIVVYYGCIENNEITKEYKEENEYNLS
jgi:hypothetical protein